MMRLWDLKEPIQQIQEFEYSDNASQLPANQFAFSADGRYVLIGDFDGIVTLWDALDGKELNTFKSNGGVYAVAFSPDNSLILTSSPDRTARLWNARSGAEIYPFPQTQDVWSATFSPDGNFALLGEVSTGVARLWNIHLSLNFRYFVLSMNMLLGSPLLPMENHWQSQTASAVKCSFVMSVMVIFYVIFQTLKRTLV